MKRKTTWILCAVLLLGLLSGCAAQQPDPTDSAVQTQQTTRQTEPSDPSDPSQPRQELINMAYYPDRSMNPYACMDYTNRTLLPLLYQGLFTADADYQVYPILCSRFTVSEDMKNHVFHIDPKARFSDGSPVTANDVAASLQAAREDGYYAGRFSHIDNISATAEGTVLIQTDCAYEQLPRLLDIPIVKMTQVGDTSPIGSGPFVMKNGGTLLEKNPDWWCGDVPHLSMDAVHLIDGKNPTNIRDQFEFADLNLVCADPGSDFYAGYRCDYELWDCENGIFVYLGCNLESTVFSNKEVRSALTTAINRDYLVENLYRGFGWAVTLPASPRSPSYNLGLAEQYKFDSDVFTRAVAKNKLKGSEIVLLTNSDDSLRTRAARAVADMLQTCGLEVEVRALGGEAYLDALRMREYDLYLGQTRLPPNMDLTEFFYEDGYLSFGPMDDKTIYALCLQALENSGNFFDLYQTIMNDGRLCPVLFRGYAVYATRGMMNGLAPARDNIFFYELGKTVEDAAEAEETRPEETTESDESTLPEETTLPPDVTTAPVS